jgi:hypothetical protein
VVPELLAVAIIVAIVVQVVGNAESRDMSEDSSGLL